MGSFQSRIYGFSVLLCVLRVLCVKDLFFPPCAIF